MFVLTVASRVKHSLECLTCTGDFVTVALRVILWNIMFFYTCDLFIIPMLQYYKTKFMTAFIKVSIFKMYHTIILY